MLGTVVVLKRTEHSCAGVIRDKNGHEYYFSHHDCEDFHRIQHLSQVTFERDLDFKRANVATLIKPLGVCERVYTL